MPPFTRKQDGDIFFATDANDLQVGIETVEKSLADREPLFNSIGANRGAICFTWDDGYATHYDVGVAAAARGQKHTFFVNSASLNTNFHLSNASLLSLYQMGHEIGSHGVTHNSVVSMTTAQQRETWDNDKAALEAVIGVGKVTSYAYPLGDRNATTDQRLYGRFERIRGISLLASSGNPPMMTHKSNTDQFLFGGLDWFPASADVNRRVRELIYLAATTPTVVVFYGHNVEAGQQMADVLSNMDYANELGVPCLRYQDVFTSSQMLRDPGFERGDLLWWSLTKNITEGVAESVTDIPDEGLPGTRSLRIYNPDPTKYVYVSQQVPLLPSKTFTLSGRARAAKVAATGALYARIRQYDSTGTSITSNTVGITSTSWARFTLTIDANNLASWALVDLVADGWQGEAFFDHLYFGPSANGSFG